MKILVLGATGDVGSAICLEAVQRDHQVTACARNVQHIQSTNPSIKAKSLDVSSSPQELVDLMQFHDVTVSALRPVEGEESQLVNLTKIVLSAACKTERLVFITGGAALLKLGDGTDHTVLSAPELLPDTVRPIAEACAAQDNLLNDYMTADWICLRPAALLVKGDRTGRYGFGRDTLVKQADGQSVISYADFAVAMLDLIELRPAPGQRLTVGW